MQCKITFIDSDTELDADSDFAVIRDSNDDIHPLGIITDGETTAWPSVMQLRVLANLIDEALVQVEDADDS